jgi:hypothetical protein
MGALVQMKPKLHDEMKVGPQAKISEEEQEDSTILGFIGYHPAGRMVVRGLESNYIRA